MIQDTFGQQIYTEGELCEILFANPNAKLDRTLTATKITIDSDLELEHTPNLIEYVNTQETLEQFDARLQAEWHMPQEYRDLDIVEYLLQQCQNDEQLQRVGQELLLYVDRNLLPLLQYLKYLVDTLRVNKIVWGVGRGSSVASYVLFLLGVHKIDSIYYDLPITEFLKEE
jgi:DNA polymerase III alpha subunit